MACKAPCALDKVYLPRALVSGFPAGAHFWRSLGAGEIVGGVDERDVAEGLREIPHLAARAGVVLLGKQPHVVPKRQQALEQDDREAAHLFKLAADQGDASAQSKLGLFYLQGRGGLPEDDREATRLWKLAADQGFGIAQFGLGSFYELGRGGLPQDYRAAARLCRRRPGTRRGKYRSHKTRLVATARGAGTTERIRSTVFYGFCPAASSTTLEKSAGTERIIEGLFTTAAGKPVMPPLGETLKKMLGP